MNTDPLIDWIMGHAWLAIFVIGTIGFLGYFGILSLWQWYERRIMARFIQEEWDRAEERRAQIEREQQQAALRNAGAITEGRRERVLLGLLAWWASMSAPQKITLEMVRDCRLTTQQAAAFMHWARGQVREHAGHRWICGAHHDGKERCLHFRLAPLQAGMAVNWPEIPAEGEARA